jgi:hypothetical protein
MSKSEAVLSFNQLVEGIECHCRRCCQRVFQSSILQRRRDCAVNQGSLHRCSRAVILPRCCHRGRNGSLHQAVGRHPVQDCILSIHISIPTESSSLMGISSCEHHRPENFGWSKVTKGLALILCRCKSMTACQC